MTARVGAIPADVESAESKRLVEVLNDLARYGNRIGSTVAITPTRDSAADLKTLLSRITDGPIGLNFDAAVFAMNGRDAVAAFRELHEHVLHVVARDGVRDIDGSGQESTLGRGDVDWPELISLLSEAEYHRWITVDRTHSDDPLRDARQAMAYLRQVVFGE
jgi:sugar phosphate isomerase/epimerase